MKDLDLPPRLERLFGTYADYHRTDGNKACHFIGIPMIMVATLGLLARWVLSVPASAGQFEGVFRADGGMVIWGLSLLWYLVLDWRIAAPFGLFSGGMYFLGRALPIWALLALMVAGWFFQFVGHYRYEKKSPAFLTNVEHLLIGPLWVFAWTVGYIPHEKHSRATHSV